VNLEVEVEMEASRHPALLTDNEIAIHPDEEIAYRSISASSMVGLALGLLAPLSLIGPLLWVIPIVGLTVSLAALMRIAASEGALVGRWAALAGLVLCVVSLSTAASRSTIAKVLVSRQARAAAIEWIATLQAGQSQQAFEQTVEGIRAASTPPTKASGEADEHDHSSEDHHGHDHGHDHGPTHTPLEEFQLHPLVHFLMHEGATMEASFERDLGVEFGARRDVQIDQQFTLRSAGDAAQPTATVEIVLVRSSPSAPGPTQWLVSSYASDDLPLPTASNAP
jgi:hypothetical protein